MLVQPPFNDFARAKAGFGPEWYLPLVAGADEKLMGSADGAKQGSAAAKPHGAPESQAAVVGAAAGALKAVVL